MKKSTIIRHTNFQPKFALSCLHKCYASCFKTFIRVEGFSNVVFGKITVLNRDVCSQTVVIVNAMQ